MTFLLVSAIRSDRCISYLTTLIAENDNLQIHEEKSKGVYVKGLSDFYVGSTKDVYEIMRQGGSARAVTSTSV